MVFHQKPVCIQITSTHCVHYLTFYTNQRQIPEARKGYVDGKLCGLFIKARYEFYGLWILIYLPLCIPPWHTSSLLVESVITVVTVIRTSWSIYIYMDDLDDVSTCDSLCLLLLVTTLPRHILNFGLGWMRNLHGISSTATLYNMFDDADTIYRNAVVTLMTP